MNAKQKAKALKAFRDLWVAGTVGGFLAALLRSVPVHIQAISDASNSLFIYDLVLRYLYMVWFIIYFLLSNLNKDTVSGLDVVFDMIQTLVSFAAAWALGIAVPRDGHPLGEPAEAFGWATGAIVVIALFSLAFFSRGENWKSLLSWGEYLKKWEKLSELTRLRILGAVAGGLGFVVTRFDPLRLIQLVLLTVIVGILAWLLWRFGRLRIGEL